MRVSGLRVEGTHAGTRRTCKLHAETLRVRIEPMTLLLWGDGTDHYTGVLPCVGFLVCYSGILKWLTKRRKSDKRRGRYFLRKSAKKKGKTIEFLVVHILKGGWAKYSNPWLKIIKLQKKKDFSFNRMKLERCCFIWRKSTFRLWTLWVQSPGLQTCCATKYLELQKKVSL